MSPADRWPNGIKITKHAFSVMAKRDIDADDIADALRRPEVVEEHEGKLRFTKNGVCVVVAEENGAATVVTVLLRERDQWTDADCRGRHTA